MDERREHKPSRLARGGKTTGRWLVTHPVGALQILAVLLLAIIVLQNLEPTSIDILFWTLVDIPKLLLLLASMLAGGLIWELLRRGLLRRRKASTTPEQ
ncbi:hypothetical protein A3724_17260 [Alcanivorax sp. HI0033]|jgi:uncharacterized integral membrane protein|uniref:hypothetical protein n=1 Tax=unclassified Alcanivorax TaxID=2638842 RepID=UPI000789DF15|nr:MULTISPECIES: hypothetical protein [unclassified Alcanivorax]KZX76123.1 hypothetical protein A3716_10410 [Alcanivorax sp. HI0011]KZX84643.1 hypothetical protein A3717_00485 [Alcanivorax sp. HI0013]KZY16525.1 hypothetical protein A3725_39320 [Alcanivorax sp. HI0035]MEE2602590.1 hypothetical protein [Pseudomonadota bacterium]KZX62168.1 hypothetical protein A3713_07280 [Alcanivorax sp. HI0003]